VTASPPCLNITAYQITGINVGKHSLSIPRYVGDVYQSCCGEPVYAHTITLHQLAVSFGFVRIGNGIFELRLSKMLP